MKFIGDLFVVISLFGLVGIFKITVLHQKLKLSKRWHNVVLCIVAAMIAQPFLPKDQPQKDQPQQETKPTQAASAQTKTTQPAPKPQPKSQPKSQPKPQPDPNSTDYASAGENGVTKTDTLFAYTKSDFDELMHYATAGNKDAAYEMESQGKVFALPPGTKVTVVNRDWATDYIEIKEGLHQGERGYVPADFILKSK